MACNDCKRPALQGRKYCQQCMPDEYQWLVPVDTKPDPFFMDRHHAYITPDNKVYVLDHTRTRAIEFGKDNSIDWSQFALNNEIINYQAGQGIVINNGVISSPVDVEGLKLQADNTKRTADKTKEVADEALSLAQQALDREDKDTKYTAGQGITISGNNVISSNIDLTDILNKLSDNDTTDRQQQELLEQLRNSISEIKYTGGQGITVDAKGMINGVTHSAEIVGKEANFYVVSPTGVISSLNFQGFKLNLLENGRVQILPPDNECKFDEVEWENRLTVIEGQLKRIIDSYDTIALDMADLNDRQNKLDIKIEQLSGNMQLGYGLTRNILGEIEIDTSVLPQGSNTTVSTKTPKDIKVTKNGDNYQVDYIGKHGDVEFYEDDFNDHAMFDLNMHEVVFNQADGDRKVLRFIGFDTTYNGTPNSMSIHNNIVALNTVTDWITVKEVEIADSRTYNQAFTLEIEQPIAKDGIRLTKNVKGVPVIYGTDVYTGSGSRGIPVKSTNNGANSQMHADISLTLNEELGNYVFTGTLALHPAQLGVGRMFSMPIYFAHKTDVYEFGMYLLTLRVQSVNTSRVTENGVTLYKHTASLSIVHPVAGRFDQTFALYQSALFRETKDLSLGRITFGLSSIKVSVVSKLD